MSNFILRKKNILGKIASFVLAVIFVFGIAPHSKVFAADTDQTNEIKYITNSSTYAFNVHGMPGDFKTTYGDNGYRAFLRFGSSSDTSTAGATQLLNIGNGKPLSNVGKTGFSVIQNFSFVNQNRYIKISYTLTNNTGSDQVVSLGAGTDVQINTNDKAPIYRTETGLRMAEGTSSTDRQFNLITKGAYGVTPVDTLWFGHYSSGTGVSGSGTGWQGQLFGNTSLNTLTETDSGISWSWKNRSIRNGATQTYSVLLGIGQSAKPPQLMQDISAVCNKDKVDVTAKFKDEKGMTDGIYYVFDMDTENETAVEELANLKATGEVQTLNSSIPKPPSWQAGEVHTVSVWVMNDAGAMSDIKTVRVVVEEDGDNMHEANRYYVSFDGGEGSRGEGPASIKAYEQSYVTLPQNTFTKTDHTFAGWQDKEGNVYPAGTEFKMPDKNVTLTAYWVEGKETYYTVEYYQQNIKDNNYKLVESKVFNAEKGAHVTAPEKDFEGFTENTATSLREIEADLPASGHADKRLKRYYDRKIMTVSFDGQGGTVNPSGTKQVRYGGMIDMPDAAKKNFKFIGWYDGPDSETANLYNSAAPIKSDLKLYAIWDSSLDFNTPDVTGTYGSPINNVKLTAVNPDATGDMNVKFEVVSNNLPEGLTLSEDGIFSGTPKTATNGVIKVQVKCTDNDTKLTKIKEIAVNIAKKELTVTGIDITAAPQKVYDGTKAISKESLDNVKITSVKGIITDDGELIPAGTRDAGLTIKATAGTYNDKNAGNNKAYEITKFEISGENSSNYTVAPYTAGKNGIITKRPVSIKATPDSMDKDEKVPEFGIALVKGTLGKGDTLADLGSPKFSCTNGDETLKPGESVKTGGNYKLTITGISNANPNYDITYDTETVFKVTDKHTVTTDKSGNGKITPTNSYEEGSTPVITWEAEKGYEVKTVVVDGIVRDELLHAGQIAFPDIAENHDVFVEFGSISSSGGNGAGNGGASVNDYFTIDTIKKGGNKDCTITGASTVKRGEDKTVEWSAASGYKVTRVLIDGVIQSDVNPNGGSKTFKSVSSNHVVEVDFSKINGGGSTADNYYFVSTEKQGEGSVDPGKAVKKGDSYEVKWTPAAGWMVDEIYIDGAKQPEGTRTADFTNITKDHNVKVIFVKDPDYKGDNQNPGEGEEKPDGGNEGSNNGSTTETYYVKTVIKGGPGEISPSATVKKGENYKVEWTVIGSSYEIESIEVIKGKTSKFLPDDTENVTLSNISDDCEVIVTLKSKSSGSGAEGGSGGNGDSGNAHNAYDIITGIIGGKGTITPTMLDVESGSDYEVEWEIADGYTVEGILVDGKMMPASAYKDCCCEFKKIKADHSVYVYLTEKGSSGSSSGSSGNNTDDKNSIYTISTEIVGPGTITPTVNVAKGSDHKVEWEPAEGYFVQTVYIDGKEVNLPADEIDFTKINASHHVKVVFAKKGSNGTDDNKGEKYSVNTGIIGGPGTITSSASGLDKGSDYPVEWSVEKGYHVVGVMLDGVYRTDLTSSSGSKDFTDINKNHSVYVYIAKDGSENNGNGGGIINPGGNGVTGGGSVTPGGDNGNLKPDNNTVISTEIVGKGEITPTTVVGKGDDHTVAWKPADGYYVWGVEVDGVPVKLPENKITFEDIAGSHNVKVIFVKESDRNTGYDPSAGVKVETSIIGGKGTITATTTIPKGDNHTVKWTAEKGYQVQSVIVDGKVRNDLIKNGEVSFKDLAENHKVQVVLISDEEAERLAKLDAEKQQNTLKNSDAVKTSDESNILALAILMIVSIGGIAVVLRKRKQN